MRKIYAVRNGRTCGLFDTWEDCKAQVHGFAGAEYKSFTQKEEAMAYLNHESLPAPSKKTEELQAYVDGSFDVKTSRFGCGVVLLYQGKQIEKSYSFSNADLVEMRNVAGEITAATLAIQYALDHNIPSITIFHDYEGIARWCTGEWKTNKDGTKRYKAFCDSVRDRLEIKFQKVAAHTGNTFNELADLLAKQALGIEK